MELELTMMDLVFLQIGIFLNNLTHTELLTQTLCILVNLISKNKEEYRFLEDQGIKLSN